MRIKRFQAPDMRSALRMIRDEQGPDAVILSNRAFAGGIEVVSATDYDEALVAQALRAAAPGLEPASAIDGGAGLPAAAPSTGAEAAPATAAQTPAPLAPLASPASAARMPAAPAEAAPRDSLMSRARAALGLGADAAVDDGPTLAELAPPAAVRVPATAPTSTAGARFDDFMVALNGSGSAPGNALPQASAPAPAPDTKRDPIPEARTVEAAAPAPETAPLRLVVAEPAEAADPALAAMRRELAQMRRMMEAQMEQLSLERLRGSPSRAACFDALVAAGCEAGLAQAVAARLDPTLAVDAIAAPMQVELARMLTVVRAEPIEDGGVIALVGPTGAGKTTTAAKLAARFAERHRARDVALVSMDDRRAGAREQLQAHGRQLGITVCEAAGPEGLRQALAQLQDYPLVLVDTAGHGPRDRVLLGQILWLRAERAIRSLLVLPANAHPDDLGEVVRRYRPAAPGGVVLTKLDEAARPGATLSVAARLGLEIAYVGRGQGVPGDLEAADPLLLARTLQDSRRAADHPFLAEDRHHAV